MKQSNRAKATLKEMETELKTLHKRITFREYIGFEICINMFKKRYSPLLKQ